MINEDRKPLISTGEFYRLISSKEASDKDSLIGTDLSQVKFKQASGLWNLDLSKTILNRVDLHHHEINKCKFNHASLQRINLSKSRLSNVDFTRANLSQSDLVQACLVGCLLKGTDFSGANLEGIDFDGIGFWDRSSKTIIEEADFTGTNLRKANLRGYNPYHTKQYLDLSTDCFKDADLTGALYDYYTRFPVGLDPQKRGAYLITAGAILVNADLSFTNLYKAHLDGADLSGANLTGARLHSANLNGANLTGATIAYEKGLWDKDLYAGVHLERAILRKATIIGICPDNTSMYLNGVDLTEASLINCAFTYMEMNGAKLAGLKLDGCKFSNAQLRGADFSHTSLRGCDLSSADLRGANFQGADLSGANLQWAQLTGTDLSGANLKGVEIPNSSLS